MHIQPFTIAIQNLNDTRDVYRIHRCLLREIYLEDFQSDLAKKTICFKIQIQDRDTALDLIESLGFEPKIVNRFTTGIEGIF
jgi:adenylate cyclase class IV